MTTVKLVKQGLPSYSVYKKPGEFSFREFLYKVDRFSWTTDIMPHPRYLPLRNPLKKKINYSIFVGEMWQSLMCLVVACSYKNVDRQEAHFIQIL